LEWLNRDFFIIQDHTNQMKLGIAYNFFNGEEHLLSSLASVRSSAEYICAVFQNISNSGEPCTSAAKDVIQTALREHLLDACIVYEPDLKISRQENERRKRRLGLDVCRKQRCSHFLTMDSDEFYRSEEMKTAKDMIREGGYARTTVSSFFHLKRPVFRSRDTTNVAFICRINAFTRIGAKRYPAQNVDPTRRVSTWSTKHLFFDSKTIAMYHMNFVRQSFSSKFNNTSTIDKNFLDAVRENIDRWKYPEPFHFPRKGSYNLEKVSNEFGAYDPES